MTYRNTVVNVLSVGESYVQLQFSPLLIAFIPEATKHYYLDSNKETLTHFITLNLVIVYISHNVF